SGGNEMNRFYFSYGNVTSNGIIPNYQNYLERNTFALRTNSTYGAFTINTSFNYVNQRLTAPATGYGSSSGGGVYNSLLQIPVDLPITDFRDYTNKYFNVNNYFTPYAENPYYALYENGDRQSLDRFFGNLDLNYKFTPHLSAEMRLGGDFTNARTFIWKNPNSPAPGSWRGISSPTNPEGFPATPDIGEVAQGSDYFGLVNTDLIVKYNSELGKDFTIDALAGANYYHTGERSELTTVTNLVVPRFFNLSNTSKPPVANDNSFFRTRVGLYGAITLGYKDQLYLTGNVRNDWSSTLPIGQDAIFYPGANVSWLASQLFDTRTTLSYLKFRAAYGKTGSDPSPYQVLAQLGPGTINLPLGSLTFPFNGVSGFGVNNTIGNPTLKPIFTNELEFGTEARFLRDRVGFDVTLYDKVTNGQIFAVPIAPSSGYTNLVENLGKVDNRGIELTFTAKPVESKNFNWNLSYVFAKNINKVIQLTGSQDPLLNTAFDTELRAVVGKTVASIYTIVPERTPSGQLIVNSTSGEPLPNTTPLDANGLVKGYMGSGLYDFTMGLTNTFTYRDFSLGFSLDFRYGGVMYSETANIILFDGNGKLTTYNDRKPFIIPNSVVATVDPVSGKAVYSPNTTYVGTPSIRPGGTLNETDVTYNYYGEGSSFTGGSDAMRIIDRSFLKLRDVNLSYNLPGRLISKAKIKSASLGIFGRNFLLWTPKGNVYVDPESTNLGNDLTGVLGEFEGTPLTKTLGIILKVTF
ncbi:MAG TPA: TonB-dependent receptor, partial [Puia sp.]|nr:TonB-dependent receptor [Puia sp.]